MTDYTKATGSSGTMMIRDTGTLVEFWLRAGSSTFNHALPWGYTVNGSTDTSNSFDFVSGGAWQKLSSWTVSVDQTVTFFLYDSSTSGLGGPTTFTQVISRADPPSPPSAPVISLLTSTSWFNTFTDGANNGAAIDSRQLGWTLGISSSVANIVSSDGSTQFNGFAPGTTYSVWARTHNSKGYSNWSARTIVTTLNVPVAPTTPIVTNTSPTSVSLSFSPNANNGAAIDQFGIGWGTSPSAPMDTYNPVSSPASVTGLTPGTAYYFFARAHNSVGWSPWSGAASNMTIAGARVKDGTVWKNAIPYVKVAGVWRLAEPWHRNVGTWSKTI